MRFLTLGEVLALHRRILVESNGRPGVRDLAAVASGVSQPRVSVGGNDAYPSLIEKAAALGYSLVRSLARRRPLSPGVGRLFRASGTM